MRFHGTTCDQCGADGKHPRTSSLTDPVRGWFRITNDSGVPYDACSIKCAIEWLKERKRQQAEGAKRARELKNGLNAQTIITPRRKP